MFSWWCTNVYLKTYVTTVTPSGIVWNYTAKRPGQRLFLAHVDMQKESLIHTKTSRVYVSLLSSHGVAIVVTLIVRCRLARLAINGFSQEDEDKDG